jgi:hypothetical protein
VAFLATYPRMSEDVTMVVKVIRGDALLTAGQAACARQLLNNLRHGFLKTYIAKQHLEVDGGGVSN